MPDEPRRGREHRGPVMTLVGVDPRNRSDVGATTLVGAETLEHRPDERGLLREERAYYSTILRPAHRAVGERRLQLLE